MCVAITNQWGGNLRRIQMVCLFVCLLGATAPSLVHAHIISSPSAPILIHYITHVHYPATDLLLEIVRRLLVRRGAGDGNRESSPRNAVNTEQRAATQG